MDIAGEHEEVTAMDIQSNGAFIFGGMTNDGQAELGFVASLTQFGTPSTFGNNGSYTFGTVGEVGRIFDLFVDGFHADQVLHPGAVPGHEASDRHQPDQRYNIIAPAAIDKGCQQHCQQKD